MRPVIVMAALMAASSAGAMELDPAVSIGAHAGVFVFDGLDVPNTSYIVTPRLGFWFAPSIGLELDVGISTGSTEVTDHNYLALSPQLNLIGNPVPEDAKNAYVRPIVTLGVGSMLKQVDGDGIRGADYAHTRAEALITVGTGFIIPLGEKVPLRLRTDIRAVTTLAKENADLGYESPFIDFSWTAGLEAYLKVAKDVDKDGIPDKRDGCPTDPEDIDAFEDEDGCPDVDNDQDGVLDVNEGTNAEGASCMNLAEDPDGFEDADGCPDPDNDQDGIPDENDDCPLEAGEEATAGCPDRDGDGIADREDTCPDQAGVLQFGGCPDTDGDGLPDPEDECPTEAGPAASFGCPDRDGDRVPDFRDKCPDKPAAKTINPRRSDGCPARVYVTDDSIVITETVYFDTGKATIKPVSLGLLDDVAAVLNQYPQIKKVQVEGHTDDQGKDDANLKISQDRAQAVFDYLVKKGVSADRLVAKGFGETTPVADNKTSAGRALNRRVAFKILEQEQVVKVKDVTDVQEGEKVIAPAPPATPAPTTP